VRHQIVLDGAVVATSSQVEPLRPFKDVVILDVALPQLRRAALSLLLPPPEAALPCQLRDFLLDFLFLLSFASFFFLASFA
jgi:hypothetical protein